MYGMEEPEKSNVKGENFFTDKSAFVETPDLMRMISRNEAYRFINVWMTDMMGPGGVIEMVKEFFHEATFDKLDWSYWFHMKEKRLVLRLEFSAILDYSIRTPSILRVAMHNFASMLRSEFDYASAEKGSITIYGIAMTLELSNNLPVEVIGSRKSDKLLKRILKT